MSSYNESLRPAVRTLLRSINQKFIEENMRVSPVFGGLNITTNTDDRSTLANFVASLITGPDSFKDLVVKNSEPLLMGSLSTSDDRTIYMLYNDTQAVPYIINVSQCLDINNPSTAAFLENMDKLAMLYSLLTPDTFMRYMEMKKTNKYSDLPFSLTKYNIPRGSIEPQKFIVNDANSFAIVESLIPEAAFIGSDAFVMRRLLLMYMMIGSYMVSLKLENPMINIRIIDSVVALSNTGVNNLSNIIDNRMRRMTQNAAQVRDLTSDVSTMNIKMKDTVSYVHMEKDSEIKVRVLSYVMCGFVLLVALGAIVTFYHPEETSRKWMSIATALVASVVVAVGYVLMSFVWVIESFISGDPDTQFFTAVTNYLTKTIEIATTLQQYATYSSLDAAVEKELSSYKNTHSEMKQGLGKVDNMYQLTKRNKIFAHARLVFATNVLLVLAVSTVSLAYVNTVWLKKLILALTAILCTLALLMYLIDTTVRVHTRSPNKYWIQPDYKLIYTATPTSI